MKRVKALNGYTIYILTARDEKNGEGFEGEYAIYFSSDVRDYGREFSTAEFDGVGSLEEAESLCNNNYAKARELVEEVQTLYDFEEFGELFEALETLEELETAEDLDEDEAEELEEVKDTLKAYL